MTISERDRRTLHIGGVVAAVLFVLAVIVPLEHSVSQLHAQVARKQADLVWMRRVAPELAAAGPAHAAGPHQSLIVLVNESAHESGLGSSLSSTGRNGSGGLSVALQHAPFDALVAWLARLREHNGVRVENADIHSSGAPGKVNASFVLRAP